MKGKVLCLPSVTGFRSKLVFNLAAPHIYIVNGPPTVPGRDLNPGPLSLDESALPTELMRPDLFIKVSYTCYFEMFITVICLSLWYKHSQTANVNVISPIQ